MHRLIYVLFILALILTAPGCGRFKMRLPTFRKPVPIAEVVTVSQWTAYPKKAAVGDDWNIIVHQTTDSLLLTNQTPRTYQQVQLWVNQQYITDVESIKIGSGNTVKLGSFINKHGETYPVPGLLTPDHSFPVLLCEIFDPDDGKRHRLMVRQ
jgi:hypothetical protein